MNPIITHKLKSQLCFIDIEIDDTKYDDRTNDNHQNNHQDNGDNDDDEIMILGVTKNSEIQSKHELILSQDPEIRNLQKIQEDAEESIKNHQRTIRQCRKKIQALVAAITVKNGYSAMWVGTWMAYYLPRRGVPIYMVWRHYSKKKDEYIVNTNKNTIHHVTTQGIKEVTQANLPKEWDQGFWYCTRLY